MSNISILARSAVNPPSSPLSEPSTRLHSIDVFRALTMFLMIFVNDLWTLQGVPGWLGHAPAGEDGLGLADVVFPAFLLIVGLAIPYAIDNRLQKGNTQIQLIYHILLRSLALIVMGVFHVNLESYSSLAFLPKPIWQISITLAFFLIWLDYPKEMRRPKRYLLQGLGILTLTVMAFLYKGGTPEDPVWMKLQWYGILGLIGWAYLICSMAFLLLKGNVKAQWLLFIFLVGFNSAANLGGLEPIAFIRPYFWIVGDGAIPAFTMAGMVVAIHYRKMQNACRKRQFWIMLGLFSLTMLTYGLLTRPIWGIHKIGDSPSWVTICIALSLVVFAFLIWVVDVKKKKHWFNLIRPAGTSTLTCYLLPYIHYALYSIFGLSLPLFMKTGMVGIVKCLIYALLIILITGLLEKWKIRLKL